MIRLLKRLFQKNRNIYIPFGGFVSGDYTETNIQMLINGEWITLPEQRYGDVGIIILPESIEPLDYPVSILRCVE